MTNSKAEEGYLSLVGRENGEPASQLRTSQSDTEPLIKDIVRKQDGQYVDELNKSHSST